MKNVGRCNVQPRAIPGSLYLLLDWIVDIHHTHDPITDSNSQ